MRRLPLGFVDERIGDRSGLPPEGLVGVGLDASGSPIGETVHPSASLDQGEPMRAPVLATSILLGSLALSAAADSGPALHPHEAVNRWGAWGPDDERGAANYITPETLVAAAALIQSGKTFSLAIPLDETGPVFPPRQPPHHTMTVTGADYLADPKAAPFGESPIRFADDYIYMPLQGSSQWDALSHAWYGDTLYNGVPESAIRSSGAGAATKLGIENVKDSLVGRGVLIDVLRHKGGSLPEGYPITRADLEAALAAQKTEVREGDIVVVRTGLVPAWYDFTPEQKAGFFTKPQTGITSDVVPWVKEKKIAAIAADTLALERVPSEIAPEMVVPLHGNLLRDLGVYIGEIWWLEELAADCAADGRYEFFLAAQPLNITGAVGSPVNPIAIK
jgi:kynurenine formamidase